MQFKTHTHCTRPVVLSVLLFLALICSVQTVKAADTVRMSAKGAGSVTGTVTKITPLEVEVVRSNNTSRKIPANAISETQYGQEPPQMHVLRTAVQGSRFDEAFEAAKKLESETFSNPFVQEDYDYFVAYINGQTALHEPENRRQMQNAIALSGTFLQKHARSYHFFTVCELLGDLYEASGNLEKATQAFSRLEKAPWLETKWKANLSLGRICLLENRPEDAKTFFQSVLDSANQAQSEKSGGDTSGPERARTEAHIGLAKCLLQGDQIDEGIAALQKLALQTDSDDARLQAAIYLSLGEAYEEMKNPREAILAYLHIDILFPSAKTERMIALKRLLTLWNQVNRPERSAEVERTLRDIQ